MSEIPNIPQGKKVIERTTADGKKEYIVRNDPNYGGPDCWLATAYFGDPLHPDVVLLRRWRDSRIAGRSDQEIGKVLVRLANTAYLSLGRTRFGIWWAQGLRSPCVSAIGVRQACSRSILRLIVSIARIRMRSA